MVMLRRCATLLSRYGDRGADPTYPTGKDWVHQLPSKPSYTDPLHRTSKAHTQQEPIMPTNWTRQYTHGLDPSNTTMRDQAGQRPRGPTGYIPWGNQSAYDPTPAVVMPWGFNINPMHHQEGVAHVGDAARQVIPAVYEPPQKEEQLLERTLCGTVTVRVRVGDIINTKCTAVGVNTDGMSYPADPLAVALVAAAGEVAAAQIQHNVEVIGEIPVGYVGSVEAGSLAAQRVFQCVGPAWSNGRFSEKGWLIGTIENALRECRFHKLESLALPYLGVGFPVGVAAEAAMDAVGDWAECEGRFDNTPSLIEFVLPSMELGEAYAAAVSGFEKNQAASGVVA
eukprot:Hpha_TRINITY_DN16325_c0_g2::TRINITY_DN16325_c0_g2_i1::g.60478::m.60478